MAIIATHFIPEHGNIIWKSRSLQGIEKPGYPVELLILIPEVDISMGCHPGKHLAIAIWPQPVKRFVCPMEKISQFVIVAKQKTC